VSLYIFIVNFLYRIFSDSKLCKFVIDLDNRCDLSQWADEV